MIRTSHVCINLAECSGSCSNVFYCAYFFNKPILKILSVYRKNILGKYALNTFSDWFMQQNFYIFYRIKYDGQSCQTVHRCSMTLMNFIEKRLCRSLFLNKLSRMQAKKESCTGAFLWVLPSISELFFAKHHWVTVSAKYPFFSRYVDLGHRKMFSSTFNFHQNIL